MSKVMVGMSGGVDSSVAAAMLQEQGHEVAGVTLRLWKESGDNEGEIRDAKKVCQALSIPHFVLDVRQTFRQTVVEDFINQYRRGRTPNPCIVCNKKIKFGCMLEFALQQGYELISTGHYAEISVEQGRYCLLQSENLQKDQSYVLYHLTQHQLAHCIFPLSSYCKEEIRKIAEERHLPVAQKPDSQDICFLPPKDYAAFLQRQSGEMPPGDFINSKGEVIGRHQGIFHYTIGQRKGLGGTFGRPMFVLKINPSDNTITLGEAGEEFSQSLRAGDVNFIDETCRGQSFRAEVMVRYKSKRYPALITPDSDGTVTVSFDQPPRAVTPGQAAVFYRGRYVIGGGTILSDGA